MPSQGSRALLAWAHWPSTSAHHDLDGVSVVVVGDRVIVVQRRAAESEAEVLLRDAQSAYRTR